MTEPSARALLAASAVGLALLQSACTEPTGASGSEADQPPAQLDVRVTNAADAPEPFEGDVVLFTVVVENVGPDTARSLLVFDSLGVGLTRRSSHTTHGAFDAGTWTLGKLDPGGADTLFLRAQVDSGTVEATLLNHAGVLSLPEATDTDPASDTASAAVVVRRRTVDLALTKEVDVTTAGARDTVRYRIVVSSAGPHAATGVRVSDTLPAGLTYLTSSATAGSWGSEPHVWTIDALDPGAADSLTIVATVDSATALGALMNRAWLLPLGAQLETDASNDADSATVDVRGADVAVTQTATPAAPSEGQDFRYDVVVRNVGVLTARDVGVTDVLPEGITYLGTYSASQGTYDAASGVWQLGGDLAVGDSASLSLGVEPAPGTLGTTIVNNAAVSSVSPPDENGGNDAGSVSVTVAGADMLAVETAATVTEPTEGQSLQLRVVVRNVGPSLLSDVTVHDTVPSGLAYAGSYGASTGSYDPATGAWTVGSLAIGDTAWLHVNAAPGEGTAGTTIVSRAWGRAAQTDTVAGNNMAEVSVSVAGKEDEDEDEDEDDEDEDPSARLTEIIELPPLPGDERSWPAAVNDSGRVVGRSNLRPVVWDEGRPRELPTLPEAFVSRPRSIDAADRIVGDVRDGDQSGGIRHLLVWEGGTYTEIPPLDGYSQSGGVGNAAGHVIGTSFDLAGPAAGFVWRDGEVTPLPPVAGDERTYAVAGNSSGLVVGITANLYDDDDDRDESRFVVWQDGEIVWIQEGSSPSPQGDSGNEAWLGVTESGDAYMVNTDVGALWRWRVAWGVWKDEVFHSIEGATSPRCSAISDAGWVVCTSPDYEWPFVARLEFEGS